MTGNKSRAYVQTPLIESVFLSKLTGSRVFLKLENTQPSGSFKSRGLGELVRQELCEHANVHFYSSSGGNAGMATAVASKFYNKPCTVVVPSLTKQKMIDRIKQTGAEVIVHGNYWADADKYLREHVMKGDSAGENSSIDSSYPVYCHPFEHPVIWQGHSTLVDEVKDQLQGLGLDRPDAVIASIGGGGLYCGIALGLERHGWNNVPVIAVETTGTSKLFQSIKAGERVILPNPISLASSLAAPSVAPAALDYALNKQATIPYVVTDTEAAHACVSFAEDHKFIVEPACGATLAILYENKLKNILAEVKPESVIVVVVCGGTSTDLEALESYKTLE